MRASLPGNDDTMCTRRPRDLKVRAERAVALVELDASTFVRRTVARAVDDVLAAQAVHHMTGVNLDAAAAVLDAPPAPMDAALRAERSCEARVMHVD